MIDGFEMPFRVCVGIACDNGDGAGDGMVSKVSPTLTELVTRLRDGFLAEAPDDIGEVGIRSDEQPWPQRWPRDEMELSYHFQALPLGTIVWFLFFLHPEGRVLLFDLTQDEVVEESDHECDLAHALRLGSKRYPELADFIPPRPQGGTVCASCQGAGKSTADEEWAPCQECYGQGWLKEGLADLLGRMVEELRSAGEDREAIKSVAARYRAECVGILGEGNPVQSYFEFALRRAGFNPSQRQQRQAIYKSIETG
jgi:hypothetical protein